MVVKISVIWNKMTSQNSCWQLICQKPCVIFLIDRKVQRNISAGFFSFNHWWELWTNHYKNRKCSIIIYGKMRVFLQIFIFLGTNTFLESEFRFIWNNLWPTKLSKCSAWKLILSGIIREHSIKSRLEWKIYELHTFQI